MMVVVGMVAANIDDMWGGGSNSDNRHFILYRCLIDELLLMNWLSFFFN